MCGSDAAQICTADRRTKGRRRSRKDPGCIVLNEAADGPLGGSAAIPAGFALCDSRSRPEYLESCFPTHWSRTLCGSDASQIRAGAS